MQTKQSAINSNVRATIIAAFGVLLMVLAVSETAQAQADQPTPLVFQAAGPDAASIQSAVDAFRAVLGATTSITQGRSRKVGARSTGTVAIPTFWIPRPR